MIKYPEKKNSPKKKKKHTHTKKEEKRKKETEQKAYKLDKKTFTSFSSSSLLHLPLNNTPITLPLSLFLFQILSLSPSTSGYIRCV